MTSNTTRRYLPLSNSIALHSGTPIEQQVAGVTHLPKRGGASNSYDDALDPASGQPEKAALIRSNIEISDRDQL